MKISETDDETTEFTVLKHQIRLGCGRLAAGALCTFFLKVQKRIR